MDAKFINPVLSAIVEVLSTMAQLQPKPGKPSMKEDNQANGVVTGLISMEGSKARGSLAISFSEPVILDIVQRMLRMQIDEVDDMARDLTGEIANMVMGGAKGRFEKQGYDFGLALPNVLSGAGHEIHHPYPGPKILLPFMTEAGDFYVEICFEE